MIYMDNAATSWPKPNIVYDTVSQAMKEYGANPGRSSHKMAVKAAQALITTRESLCRLFNTPNPFSMVFTFNTTDSLNLAIKGLLKKRDHVITTSMEHNSVVRPLMHLARAGIDVTIVPTDSTGIIDPVEIEKAIKGNTKLIVTTHASNVTGTVMPIEKVGKIAKQYGVLYLVDAAQTAGLIPLDLSKLEIDLLAMPGHKGLLGPQGTGVLFIREGTSLNQIREGGTGSQSENIYQPGFLPDRYESGTMNTPGIAGMGAGIEYILSRDQEKSFSRIQGMEEMFIDALNSIKGVKVYGPKSIQHRAGIISINIGDKDSREIVNILNNEYDIAARGSLHCAPLAHETIGTKDQGTVRFSPGVFSTREEIRICVKAIEDIIHRIKTRSI